MAAKKTSSNQNKSTSRASTYAPPQEEFLFKWTAPARPFKKRNKEFWVSVIAMASIASLILLIIEGPISVLLVVAVVFLFYVLSTVKPESIEYKITNYSVMMGEDKTDMSLFTRFWFSKRFENDLLILEKVTLPGRMEFVINAKDKKDIKKALLVNLPEEEAPPTNLDKTANWFSEKIPGN